MYIYIYMYICIYVYTHICVYSYLSTCHELYYHITNSIIISPTLSQISSTLSPPVAFGVSFLQSQISFIICSLRLFCHVPLKRD